MWSFLLILMSCSPYKIFKKDHITLSESPCIDGTILNIGQSGCEVFYWGTQSEDIVLKIRCTYSPKRNFWTEMDFYTIPHSYELLHVGWNVYCEDRFVKMYALPHGTQLRIKNN